MMWAIEKAGHVISFETQTMEDQVESWIDSKTQVSMISKLFRRHLKKYLVICSLY